MHYEFEFIVELIELRIEKGKILVLPNVLLLETIGFFQKFIDVWAKMIIQKI